MSAKTCMTPLQVGSRVEVWERRGQSERLCYVGVITAEDGRFFQVRVEPDSISAESFQCSDLKQCDNTRRCLKAVQS